MYILFFIILLLSMCISCICVSSPLVLGFLILVLSLLVGYFCCLTYLGWFRFTLFLIYVGGILVIFSYFLAIQPNQKFSITEYGILFFILGNLIWHLSSLTEQDYYNDFIVESFYSGVWFVSLLFSRYNLIVFILLGFVLFLALVSVVKVTNSENSPLRPFKS